MQKNPRRRFTSAQQVSQLLADCRDALIRGNGVELPEDARQLLAAIREQPHANTPLSGKVAPDSLPGTPPRAKRRNRLLVGVAAALLVFVLGLGMTEGTGVTNFRGTVVTLFTSQGTLVVEVDDPDVELAIDGEELVVKGAGVKELRLRPGEYQLEANKAGKLLQKEIVRVDRNGRTVVRIRQDVEPEVAAAEASVEAAQPDAGKAVLPPPELSRKPVRLSGGDWRGEYELVNGEFIQAKHGNSGVNFGSLEWSDFDLKVDMMPLSGEESGHIVFRSNADASKMYLVYFNIPNKTLHLSHTNKVESVEFEGKLNQWYRFEIRSRGDQCTILVDGVPLLEAQGIGLLQGCIGFNTYYSSTKWRNLSVTSPDGQLLWEGFPEVPLSERKMAEIVLDLGGIVSMHGETKEIRRVEDLPPGNQRLTNVTLASLPNVTKEKLLPLEDTRHLTNLGLDYAPNIDDEVLTIFRHNKNLEGMGLSRSRITAEGLRSLEGFDKLDRIWLTASAIQNDDLSAFEVFPNLTALGLSDTKITDAGLHHLSNIPKLTWLILDRTAVTNEGLRKLSEIKTLRRIELNGTKVTDEGLVYLQNLPDLDRVMIKETKVSLAGIQKLYETHPGVVVVWDGYSWTKKKDPPDYDEIATREWLPLLRSQEEIDQLISEKAFIYDGLEAPPEISFQDGVTELRGGGLFFRALRAKNGILRAKLRHIEGFHVDLVLRKGYGNEKTHLSYNGDGTFHIGRSRNGWKPLLGRFFQRSSA